MTSPPSTTENSSPSPEPTCPCCDEPYGGGKWIGYEVPGVYDGVLYWSCSVCGFAWSRDWTGYGRRAGIAQQIVDQINADRERRAQT